MGAQFLGIGLLVGAQALSNLHEQHAPQGGPLLLGLSAVSAVALSALCAVKWRLSVRFKLYATHASRLIWHLCTGGPSGSGPLLTLPVSFLAWMRLL